MNKYLLYLNPDEKSRNLLYKFNSSLDLIVKKFFHLTVFEFYSAASVDELVSEFTQITNDKKTPRIYKSNFFEIKSYDKKNKPCKLVLILSNPYIKELHLKILDTYKHYLNSKEDNHKIVLDSKEFRKNYAFFRENYVPHITLAEASLSSRIKYSFFNDMLLKTIYFESMILAKKDNDGWKSIDKKIINTFS